MRQLIRRGAALVLALAVAVSAAAASASYAMGWEIHTGSAVLSQGTQLGKNIFWSDTYSDLRSEFYVSYTPNTAVTPTVAYGDKVITRATLSSMARSLESQGKRVISGINGDYYVMATGAPVGLVVSDGVLRSTSPYTTSWAVGFRADGTAFMGTPNLTVTATFNGQTIPVSGGVNKIRKLTASDGTGGLTLMTSDFATTTQNTQPGVDVILTPIDPDSQEFADALANANTPVTVTPTPTPSESPAVSETPAVSESPAASESPAVTETPAATGTPAEETAAQGESVPEESPAPAPAESAALTPVSTTAATKTIGIPVAGASYSTQTKIGSRVLCKVTQVLESTGAVSIPEGSMVLTLNASDNATQLAMLRALKAGDLVDISITSKDSRWNSVTQALGAMYKLVTDGQVHSGLSSERTARTAVGIKADGTVIFYAMDGKQAGYSVGATLTQVAQRLVELGCVEAVCMDGGGSTTLGVTTPVEDAMQVLTSPSDGAQRANSTALFLTTTLQPTGVLASYFVTPGDSMLLAGATVSLSAVGVDTNYYETASSNPLTWSVSAGGGTVDESGVFTAPAQSGFSTVTASDGTASGSAYVTTVDTPDSITVSNQSTGAAVTALALNPGEKVDLTASAVYRKLSLTAQDACFTWSLDSAVGTVDADGVLTAGDKSGTGTLTVSAGGKSAAVTVTVAGHINELESFEDNLNAFAATDTASGALETGLDHVRYGRQSMRLSYDASAAGAASLTSVLPLPSGESYVGLWVYGDGSGNTLLATAVDAGLNSQQFLLTALDFTGWKYVCAALPQGAINLTSLDVVYAGGDAASGVIWLDQITTSNEFIQDAAAPTVSVTVSGTQLTASVLDNMDRNIPAENLSLTYDGAALDFQWDPVTGVLTAQLPAADSSYHRVNLTARDNSGNLGRAGADIKPASSRDPAFADTDDHWAGEYATWLYDRGISQGTGEGAPQFQPDKNITRAEFFALVARWLDLDLTQYANVTLPFADAGEIPDWALGEVKAMYSLGILQGSLDNGLLKVNAGATITRAEAMVILGRTQAKGYTAADLSGYTDAAQVPDWAEEYVASLVGQGLVSGYNNAISPLSSITRGEVAKLLYVMK